MVSKLFQPTLSPGDSCSSAGKKKLTKEKSVFIDNVDLLRTGNNRLPTPEKVAILELSDSFEKRRLGKQQQILQDISQRCREQEISEMSQKISTKYQPTKHSNHRADMSFYNTACSVTPRVHKSKKQSTNSNQLEILQHMSTMPAYEKGRSHFPVRKIIRNQRKCDSTSNNLPSVQVSSKNKNPDGCLSANLKIPYENNQRCNVHQNNSKPHNSFDNIAEMENYYFPRRRATPIFPEQNTYHEKVVCYLESLRKYQERTSSGDSANTYYRRTSREDSGIYMAVANQDKRFTPLKPVSTIVGSSKKYGKSVTQTSITSFL